MQMKKLLTMLLAIALTFALFGCDQAETPVLRVAMSPDFPPMEFLDSTKTGQDRFLGFDVSLAKYLAKGLDMELEIVPMDFEDCQDAVADGEVDMAISGFSWLPQREVRFNLSRTYRAGENSSHQLLLTAKENAARFNSPEALSGISIGAQTASLQAWLVQEQLPGAYPWFYDDLDKGIQLLREGTIEAMAVAEGNANAILAANPDLAKAEFRFEVSDELTDNLILLKKGNDTLTDAVNTLLEKAEAAGYYSQWYAEALQQAGIDISATIPNQE